MSARHALSAVTAMPADSRTLALLPVCDAWTDRIDHAGHFVACDTGIDKTRPMALFDEGIAMTHAAGFHLNADRIGTRVRYCTLDHLKCATGTLYLYGHHL